MRCLLGAVILGLVAMPAWAAPVLDGTLDASYSLRATQTVQTQFGDANPNSGSELDAGWAQIDSGNLYLMLTGNLENNFNKLDVFVSTGAAGGQNQLQADANSGGNNPTNDGWANKYAGFTFDSGFAANYMLIVRNGNSGGDRFDIDFATIGGGANAFEAGGDVFGGSQQGSNANALPGAGIGVAFNNTNTGGVTGGTAALDAAGLAAAQAVTTGLELKIPLAAIGNPNLADIKISAMVNGSSHDFLSNQFLGGLPGPQGNLGGPLSQINLNTNIAGNQYFTVVPEPATMSLACLALAGLVSARRRK